MKVCVHDDENNDALLLQNILPFNDRKTTNQSMSKNETTKHVFFLLYIRPGVKWGCVWVVSTYISQKIELTHFPGYSIYRFLNLFHISRNIYYILIRLNSYCYNDNNQFRVDLIKVVFRLSVYVCIYFITIMLLLHLHI